MKKSILAASLVFLFAASVTAVEGYNGDKNRPHITSQPGQALDTPEAPDNISKPGIIEKPGQAVNGLKNTVGNVPSQASEVLNTEIGNTGESLGNALQNLLGNEQTEE